MRILAFTIFLLSLFTLNASDNYNTGKSLLCFNLDNNRLPSDTLFSIIVDKHNNKWFSLKEHNKFPNNFALVKFNGYTATFWDIFNNELKGLTNQLLIDSKNNLWMGFWSLISHSGFIKFDGNDKTEYHFLDSLAIKGNLGLFISTDYCIDANDHIWFGSDINGNYFLSTFDEKNIRHLGQDAGWKGVPNLIHYNNKTEELWFSVITPILIYNKKSYKYLVIRKYDGSLFVKYDSSNSALPSNKITLLTNDSLGNIWLLSIPENGLSSILTLSKFDGEKFTNFQINESLQPESNIVFDSKNNMFYCSKNKLIQFDGETFKEIFYSENETKPHTVSMISIDHQDNIWMCSQGAGLLVYREGGVILPKKPSSSGKVFLKDEVFSVFPNPFSEFLNINYEIKTPGNVTFSMYDVLGNKAAVLFEGYKEAGRHKILFSVGAGSEPDLTKGVYFLKMEAGGKIENQLIIKN